MLLPALGLGLLACGQVQAGLPACTDAIAAHYRLPAGVLHAIHAIEGGRNGLSVTNEDGSADRGLMQINTFWDRVLKDFDISPNDLLTNGCTNVAVGAWVLRQEVTRFGNWFDALAAYNAGAGNLRAGRAYARKVLGAWRARLARPAPEPWQQGIVFTFQ